MNTDFIIDSGGFELLSEVEELWCELKAHHKKIGPEFPDLSTPNFQIRKEGLEKRGKEILVEYARSKISSVKAGYSISIIDNEGIGEIESLYVQESFRGTGIGKELVKRSLSWLEQKNATSVRLSVLSGNTEAIEFYKSFGFRSRVQELMIPTNET